MYDFIVIFVFVYQEPKPSKLACSKKKSSGWVHAQLNATDVLSDRFKRLFVVPIRCLWWRYSAACLSNWICPDSAQASWKFLMYILLHSKERCMGLKFQFSLCKVPSDVLQVLCLPNTQMYPDPDMVYVSIRFPSFSASSFLFLFLFCLLLFLSCFLFCNNLSKGLKPRRHEPPTAWRCFFFRFTWSTSFLSLFWNNASFFVGYPEGNRRTAEISRRQSNPNFEINLYFCLLSLCPYPLPFSSLRFPLICIWCVLEWDQTAMWAVRAFSPVLRQALDLFLFFFHIIPTHTPSPLYYPQTTNDFLMLSVLLARFGLLYLQQIRRLD